MKRVIACLCLFVLALSGCGSDEGGMERQKVSKTGAEKNYKQENFYSLPEESMVEEDLLLTTDLQTNLQGEPALYQFVTGTDDTGDESARIMEYSLNSEGNWQKRKICEKALLKRTKEETEHYLAFPFIERGDDGNLYALLKSYDEEDSGPMGDSSKKAYCAYSVLAIDEEKNAFREIRLQTKAVSDEGKEVDYAREFDVTKFHVREDGTFFLVFSGASALWFDGATGTQTNVCTTIADGAFGKSVAFGESEILYFSSSRKLFGVMDSDSLDIFSYFGKELPEENKKYDWYFYTDTTSWQTFAFNQSGLYRITDFGKKASARLLSGKGNFDNLADDGIYDILVGANHELYILVRRAAADEDNSETSWEFGIAKYQAD